MLTPEGDGGQNFGGKMDLEIYGGNEANPKNLPWQVLLRGPAGCGGTLVSMTVGNPDRLIFYLIFPIKILQ